MAKRHWSLWGATCYGQSKSVTVKNKLGLRLRYCSHLSFIVFSTKKNISIAFKIRYKNMNLHPQRWTFTPNICLFMHDHLEKRSTFWAKIPHFCMVFVTKDYMKIITEVFNWFNLDWVRRSIWQLQPWNWGETGLELRLRTITETERFDTLRTFVSVLANSTPVVEIRNFYESLEMMQQRLFKVFRSVSGHDPLNRKKW